MPDTRNNEPASGAAPEERDGELDDLLREYRDLVAEQEARVADHTEALEASLADIHAHVAAAKREAREAASNICDRCGRPAEEGRDG